MALRTGLYCVDQRSTSVFSCPSKQEFDDSESQSCIACQLRVAEARIEVVDDDLRLATPLNTSCKFPSIEDFEQLGHPVSEFVSQTPPWEGTAYLSAMFAVSLSLNVLKMLGLFFSGKLVKA